MDDDSARSRIPASQAIVVQPAHEGVDEHEEPGAGLRGPAAWRAYAREVFTRRFLAYLGPGFLVSVGYMDPGNWGTDLEGGARFGYDLLWVLLVSNLMAIVLQALAAKLGLVTNRSLAENCRRQLHPALNLFLWATAELAMMATDLAEFLGAALGFYILLRIPLALAGLLTGGAVFLVLALSRYGYRPVEYVIMGLVSVIGVCYLIEVALARPDWGQVAYHVVVPRVNSQSIVVAVGMLGATVMPHNLFLHSGVVRSRALPGDAGHTGRLVRYATADAIFALNMAWLVNSAIVVMAAATFHRHGLSITSITEAHQTLKWLGPMSSAVFAIALLCSGLSSSVTGTMAGQIVIEGFLNVRFSIWLRRLITMVPAMVVILLGVNEIKALVLSQVALSLQLPFAIVPLLLFTRDRRLMGEHANRPTTMVVAWLIAAAVVLLNVLLLVRLVGGSF
jgi:manganese transport protein